MIEQSAEALDNGEAETEASRVGSCGVGKPVEFAEYIAPLVVRDPGPTVRYFDAQCLAAAPAADDHAAGRGVAHGVGDEVEHDPFEEHWIAAHPRAVRHQP